MFKVLKKFLGVFLVVSLVLTNAVNASINSGISGETYTHLEGDIITPDKPEWSFAGSGTGDMEKTVYDPTLVEGDAFDPENHPILSVSESTALISGGDLSINVDNTKFDITSGSGTFIDSYTDPAAPVVTPLSWTPFTAESVTNLATQDVTYISINSSGTLVQSADLPFEEDIRDKIVLGALIHFSRTKIDFVSSFTQVPATSLGASMNDINKSLGIVNVGRGNTFSANGSNLKLNKSVGQIWSFGINYKNNRKNPSFISTAQNLQMPFTYQWRDGSGEWISAVSTITDIVPGKYDDNTGGASSPNGIVSDFQYTIKRIFYSGDTDTLNIQYGQEVYANLDSAIASVHSENWNVEPINDAGLLYRGALIVRGDATDLSDSDQAVFVEIDKFGQKNIEAGISAGVTNMYNYANGVVIDPISEVITSDGLNVTFSVERDGTGDLTVQFDGKNFLYITDPADTIILTAGSNSAPTLNYVYLTESGGTITLNKNTTGFPVTQHAPLATVLVQSAVGVQNDGVYKHHMWDNSLGNGEGGWQIITSWVRNQSASWIDGVVPTTTITVNGGAIDNVDFSNTSGTVLQLHSHTFPALNMGTGDIIYVANDSTTAFDRLTDLSALDTDSTGATLRSNNTYYSIVVWGVVSESAGDSHLYANSPSGFYTSEIDAINDPNGYNNFTIPTDFKGTGFLIARIVLRYQTIDSGTLTEIQTEDLRGLQPSTAAGGGGVSAGTEFSDNLFKIFNVADSAKELQFDLSGITTANTRIISWQDKDITVADDADIVNLTDNQTIAGEKTFTANQTFGQNVVITGDLTVNGTETILNTSTLEVEAKVITNANVTTPTDVTADAAGWTIKGATDKIIQWLNLDDLFHFNQGIRIDNANGLTFNDGTIQTTAASSSVSYPSNIYSSTAASFAIDEDVSITHNLGLTQADVISGKYSVYITFQTSATVGYVAPPSSSTAYWNSDALLRIEWNSGIPTLTTRSYFQANTLKLQWGTAAVTNARVHIKQNFE